MGISTDLELAASVLRAGEVAAIPTETVYGLAAVATEETAVRKIFELKQRPFFDPLIVHIAEMRWLDKYVEKVDPVLRCLGEKFWPGPLTIVFPKREIIPSIVTSGLDSVAIRIPKHPLALALIEELGMPLAAPSANKFGKTSPTSAAHVRDEFSDTDLMILDGGNCDCGIESTVLALENIESFQSIAIYRPGLITSEMVAQTIHDSGFGLPVIPKQSQVAPGQLDQHYMPRLPLAVLDDRSQLMNAAKQLGLDAKLAYEIHLDGDPLYAARELYGTLRRSTENRDGFVYLLWRDEWKSGAWTAIWDRVQRASTLILRSNAVASKR